MSKTTVKTGPKVRDEKGFHYFALALMTVLAIFCVVPFILMISVSFSSEAALVKGYKFWPQEFSMSAYSYLWIKRATILRAYGLTIFVTVVGTAAAPPQPPRFGAGKCPICRRWPIRPRCPRARSPCRSPGCAAAWSRNCRPPSNAKTTKLPPLCVTSSRN